MWDLDPPSRPCTEQITKKREKKPRAPLRMETIAEGGEPGENSRVRSRSKNSYQIQSLWGEAKRTTTPTGCYNSVLFFHCSSLRSVTPQHYNCCHVSQDNTFLHRSITVSYAHLGRPRPLLILADHALFPCPLEEVHLRLIWGS